MCASSEAALRARNTQKQRDRTLHDAASHRIAAAQSPRARQLCHNGLQEAEHGDITPARRVISSVVERFVHIEDVGGSNPSSPTIPPAETETLRVLQQLTGRRRVTEPATCTQT